jgi:hypothetical protein
MPCFRAKSAFGKPRREDRQILAKRAGQARVGGPHDHIDLAAAFRQPHFHTPISTVHVELYVSRRRRRRGWFGARTGFRRGRRPGLRRG